MKIDEIKKKLLSALEDGADAAGIFDTIISEISGEIDALNSQITDITTERDNLSTSISERDATISDLKAKNDDLKQTNLRLFSKIPVENNNDNNEPDVDMENITIDDLFK